MKSDLAIELKGIHKNFNLAGPKLIGGPKTQLALSDLNLKIDFGEFVFLTGSSGAGKTTLIKIILGLLKPSAGRAFSLGTEVSNFTLRKNAALRRKIGIIFQQPMLHPNLNVSENIELPLYFEKISEKEKKMRVWELLEILGLNAISHVPVQILSAGEKQKVSLARSLVLKPKLIVADEPTGNLDPQSAQHLVKLLHQLRSFGSSILFATHDMSLVKSFGGRVLELVAGNVHQSKAAQKRSHEAPSFFQNNTGELTP